MTSILRSFGLRKGNKHHKLSEEWTASCQESVQEGITFPCKYIGSTPIEQNTNNTNSTCHAVKHIVTMAKAKGGKFPEIALFITPQMISGRLLQHSSEHSPSSTMMMINDDGDNKLNNYDDDTMKSSDHLFNLSIYRIPYCFAESTFDRIVAFVATNPNGVHECHAIMAAKRKIAHAIALTISKAFDIAFERMKQSKIMNGGDDDDEVNCGNTNQQSNLLIDLNDDDDDEEEEVDSLMIMSNLVNSEHQTCPISTNRKAETKLMIDDLF